MKKEHQVMKLLEDTILKIESLCEKIPKDPKEVSEEEKMHLGFLIAQVITLGVVLDMEEELKPFIAQLRIANIASSLNGKI